MDSADGRWTSALATANGAGDSSSVRAAVARRMPAMAHAVLLLLLTACCTLRGLSTGSGQVQKNVSADQQKAHIRTDTHLMPTAGARRLGLDPRRGTVSGHRHRVPAEPACLLARRAPPRAVGMEKWCVLLTATINVQVDLRSQAWGQQQQRDPSERRDMYLRVLKHWASLDFPVVFVENSFANVNMARDLLRTARARRRGALDQAIPELWPARDWLPRGPQSAHGGAKIEAAQDVHARAQGDRALRCDQQRYRCLGSLPGPRRRAGEPALESERVTAGDNSARLRPAHRPASLRLGEQRGPMYGVPYHESRGVAAESLSNRVRNLRPVARVRAAAAQYHARPGGLHGHPADSDLIA